MVHSLDSLKLAAEIQRLAEKAGKIMDVLVEVNLAGELSKSGVAAEEIGPLAAELAALPNLRLRGLMTVPPLDATELQTEKYFEKNH